MFPEHAGLCILYTACFTLRRGSMATHQPQTRRQEIIFYPYVRGVLNKKTVEQDFLRTCWDDERDPGTRSDCSYTNGWDQLCKTYTQSTCK